MFGREVVHPPVLVPVVIWEVDLRWRRREAIQLELIAHSYCKEDGVNALGGVGSQV